MRSKKDVWAIWLGLLLVVTLLAPGLVQAKEEGVGSDFKMQCEKLIKELNLAPDKAKEFLAVGGRYDQSRKGIIEGLKKDQGELEEALAAPQPDEGKIKALVGAVTGEQEKFFETFKAQRQEEMALLTPIQQGKFLVALRKWHQEMGKKGE